MIDLTSYDAQAKELGAVRRLTYAFPRRKFSYGEGGVYYKHEPFSVHYMNEEVLEIGYLILDLAGSRDSIHVLEKPRRWDPQYIRNCESIDLS